MKTESEILKTVISMFESGQIQSKYLVTVHVNHQLLYWKDIHYEIEKKTIIDTFLMGRWNYEPGTIILIKMYILPSSTSTEQYELIFQQSGIEVTTRK